MSIINSSKAFLLYPYRFKPLRILIIILLSLVFLYLLLAYTLVPFLLTKTLKENYLQQTGHQLQSDKVVFSPLHYTLVINHLKDSADLWQAESIFVDLSLVQSISQFSLVVNEINIGKLVANPLQHANGEWNFDDVLKHISSANKPTTKKTANNSIPLVIKKISVTNATVNSNALALNNLPLVLAPLNITLNNIDLRGNNSSTFTLSTQINKVTPLVAKGSVKLQILQAEVDVDVSALPFVWFNDALKSYVSLDVLDGFVETHSHISITSGVPQKIVTSGKLTNLKWRPANIEQDVVKWKSLAWNDAVVVLNDKSAKIPLISLDEFDGQFIIHKDRTNNIQAMLLKPAESKSPPKTTSGPTVNAPWKFTVDRVAINNAAVGFYDQSLIPSFMVIVQQFSGDITNLSNDEQQVAQINLAGNVDGTAPVHLSGQAKPFIDPPQLDILFSFQKMDMGAFSPYSAEYAGWRIKKGLLSVDLHYRFEKGLIVGKNHVVMDHLEFGEKVRSPNAIDLPLRLALTLLTDEKGIAVLDADISGDLKNPNFNIGAAVKRAFVNSLKKIISAPFRFLSNLIHSNEDLGRVEFIAGESQLSEQAINKLKLLQEALTKRPKMRLSIQGAYDKATDLQALKYEQVKSTLQKQGLGVDAINSQNGTWEKAIAAFYKAKGLTNLTVGAAQKYQELADLEIVAQERLNTLAHERALAVKQYFVLTLGVASDTLLLDSDTGCAKSNSCTSREVVFKLEN